MSSKNKQITALLSLLDDPDVEVSDLVQSKLISFGGKVIPELEAFWETAEDEMVQERLEEIIHLIQWETTGKDFAAWKDAGGTLMEGLFLTCRYFFPDIRQHDFAGQVEPLRKSLWLELNAYLTPLEQGRVLEKIIFGYYGFKVEPCNLTRPLKYLVLPLLQTQRGNKTAMQMLYLLLAEQLDLLLRAVYVNHDLLLGWFHPPFLFGGMPPEDEGIESILFFSDAMNGTGYSPGQMYTHLRQQKLEVANPEIRPLNHRQVIAHLLRCIADCFEDKGQYRKSELLELAALLG